MMAFTVCSLIAVVAGNARRALYIYRYVRAQPTVHKLMPNGFRNLQMAWVCNFWTAAVFLEASSLSDYMVRLGHPVEADRYPRDAYVPPQPLPPRVESIARPLVMDKLKYQDLPMLALLLLHFLASFAGYQSSPTVSIVQIGITLVSLLSGYLATAWVGDVDGKGVDLMEVIVAVEERVAEAEQARLAQAKSTRHLVSNTGDQSSNDTDRSEASSHGINDVM